MCCLSRRHHCAPSTHLHPASTVHPAPICCAPSIHLYPVTTVHPAPIHCAPSTHCAPSAHCALSPSSMLAGASAHQAPGRGPRGPHFTEGLLRLGGAWIPVQPWARPAPPGPQSAHLYEGQISGCTCGRCAHLPFPGDPQPHPGPLGNRPLAGRRLSWTLACGWPTRLRHH